ncbi:MAG TPA: hypothetical protein VFO00_00960 [Vitreimonas sp.]|nr:hypothetical protein [Vitreimonas sp.]
MATVGRQSEMTFALSLRPERAALIMLAVCAAVFAFAQIDLWHRNGFWIDEYFSLWASDPAIPLARLLTERIFPDTNPPLYFSLLALVRVVVDDPRSAFLILNLIAIALTALFVVARGRSSGVLATALLATSLFIISGPVLYYVAEGRAYLMGLCAAFAIAWHGATVTESRAQPADLRWFAALGVLSALAHVFAALFAGAFAAGLAIEGLLKKRLDLLRAGLTLGVSATAVFGVWLVFALPHMGNVAWIEFSFAAIREALWYVRQLTFGHALMALAVIAFLAWSSQRKEMRPHLRIFAIAMVLFAALPLLASFITPLVTGRYWLIGALAILVVAAFALRAELSAASTGGPNATRSAAGAAFGALSLLAASALSFVNAQAFMETKPVWRGAGVVALLLGDCGPGAVHVWENHLYATASGAPESTFRDASRPDAPVLDASASGCAVLGWAEHVRRGDDYLLTASDAELLAQLRIAATPDEVRILRHSSGFVVLKREAAESAR